MTEPSGPIEVDLARRSGSTTTGLVEDGSDVFNQACVVPSEKAYFLVDSFTVVRGFFLTVDCFTNRPVIALRPRPPLLLDAIV